MTDHTLVRLLTPPSRTRFTALAHLARQCQLTVIIADATFIDAQPGRSQSTRARVLSALHALLDAGLTPGRACIALETQVPELAQLTQHLHAQSTAPTHHFVSGSTRLRAACLAVNAEHASTPAPRRVVYLSLEDVVTGTLTLDPEDAFSLLAQGSATLRRCARAALAMQ